LILPIFIRTAKALSSIFIKPQDSSSSFIRGDSYLFFIRLGHDSKWDRWQFNLSRSDSLWV